MSERPSQSHQPSSPASSEPLDDARIGALRVRCSAIRACSSLGRRQLNPIHPEAARRSGWRRHGSQVIAEHDLRLSWSERELVRQLGAKLYGDRWEGGR